MTTFPHMLADGPLKELTDLIFPLVVFAIVVLMKILSSVLQKKQGGQERQSQQERWDEIRKQRAERLQQEQAQQQARATRVPAQQRPAPLAPPASRPAPALQPLAPAAAAQQLAPAQTAPKAQPVLQPVRRRPLEALEEPAAQTLPHPKASHDVGHLPGLHTPLRGDRPVGMRAAGRALAEAPAGEVAPVKAVAPLDAKSLRKAIIHLEILSAPKALRKGAEMWEQ
jgi:hypothetical protein